MSAAPLPATNAPRWELPLPAGAEVTVCALPSGEAGIVLSYPIVSVPLHVALTAAEQDVAMLLLRGASAAAIAKARMRSLNTVNNQIRSIYHKLGVSGRLALARKLVR